MKIYFRYIRYILSIALFGAISLSAQNSVSSSINISLRVVDGTYVNILNESQLIEDRNKIKHVASENPNRQILVQFKNRQLNNQNFQFNKIEKESPSIKISSNTNESIVLKLDSEIDVKQVNRKEAISILYKNTNSAKKETLETSITLVY